MVKTIWTDLDAQGRRMHKIVRLCDTMISELMESEDKDHTLIMSYIDRLVKTSSHQAHLTDMVLNLSMLKKLAEKRYIDQITDIKLKELV